MVNAILNSGVLNPALWAAAAALAYLAGVRFRHAPRRLGQAAVAVLAAGAGVSLAAGLYRSYAVPRDVLQDIIAAREYMAGRPMHPADMNVRMRAALAEEGERGTLLGWWPEMARREHEQYEETLTEHWVQAHPPPMTLLTVPLVSLGGVLGAQVVYTALALLGLGLSLWLMKQELWPDETGLLPVAAGLAVAGSADVVAVCRLQQPGLLIVGLLTAAWAWLRRGRPERAGVAVALAAGLKLIPGLMWVPILIRHRRAAVALVLTAVVGLVLVVALVPLSDIRDYRATADGVVDEYATYPSNISLLGVYARGVRYFGGPVAAARTAWTVTVLVVMGCWAWLLATRPAGDPRAAVDYEFAVGMALFPLLSPVAWDHYRVYDLLPLAVLADRVLRPGAGLAARVGLGVLLVLAALPEASFLWALDQFRGPGGAGVRVWVIEPVRAVAGVVLVAWLVRLWLAEQSGPGPSIRPTPG